MDATIELDLTTIQIVEGAHDEQSGKRCAMEWVAYLAHEPHGDHPACACPVIASYVRTLNDKMPDDETRNRLLGPRLKALIGSRSTPAIELRRALFLSDRAIRLFLPMALRSAKLEDEALKMESLAEVKDSKSARAAWAAESARAAWAAESAAESAGTVWQAAVDVLDEVITIA